MGYHRKRENVWSLLYCIVITTTEKTDVLIVDKDTCLMTLSESLTGWECVDVGSYFTEDALVIKFDAPPTLNIPAFVNALKTRLSRLYGSGIKGIWNAGYFVATMGNISETPEADFLRQREGTV